MTREEFIDKALKCHEEGEVDYSQVVYVNSKTKVKLIDKIYGEYWQTPSNHLRNRELFDMKSSLFCLMAE